jgi:hypothetical protein
VREGDHAVHEVSFDDFSTDLAFAALVGGHAAVGEDLLSWSDPLHGSGLQLKERAAFVVPGIF